MRRLFFDRQSAPRPGHTTTGVILMEKQKRKLKVHFPFEDLRLEPERRLCARFDALSIAGFPVARREEMGFRVVDNCAEEHIM